MRTLKYQIKIEKLTHLLGENNIENSKKYNKTYKNVKYGRKTRKHIGGKWSAKYKRSINCNRPKGFSQKQYCKYGRNK